jgi:hypothetical protein
MWKGYFLCDYGISVAYSQFFPSGINGTIGTISFSDSESVGGYQKPGGMPKRPARAGSMIAKTLFLM